MKIKIHFKALIGYMGIIGLFRYISLFVDDNLGTVMFVLFIACVIMSLLGLILTVKCTNIETTSGSRKILKGKSVDYSVNISSKLPIGFGYVCVDMVPQKYLRCQNQCNDAMMVDRFMDENIRYTYDSTVFGEDVIEASAVGFIDVLGMVSVWKKKGIGQVKVYTLPRYVEHFYNRNLLIFSKYVADYDECEESAGTTSVSSGFPGYEYREYEEGDSLKRINYKLSAKKQTLMVRMDEQVVSMRMAVILDNMSSGERFLDEYVIEGMMAYVGCMHSSNITVEVYYRGEGNVCHDVIADDMSMEAFVARVSNVKFTNDKKFRPELKNISKYTGIVIFTATQFDKEFYDSVKVPYQVVTSNGNISGKNVLYIDKYLDISDRRVGDIDDNFTR